MSPVSPAYTVAPAYGVIAAFQPSNEFGRVLAAYGGVFIVGSLLWGVALDGFHLDRADLLGALTCLAGVAIIITHADRTDDEQDAWRTARVQANPRPSTRARSCAGAEPHITIGPSSTVHRV